jgi:hypothetical protein
LVTATLLDDCSAPVKIPNFLSLSSYNNFMKRIPKSILSIDLAESVVIYTL